MVLFVSHVCVYVCMCVCCCVCVQACWITTSKECLTLRQNKKQNSGIHCNEYKIALKDHFLQKGKKQQEWRTHRESGAERKGSQCGCCSCLRLQGPHTDWTFTTALASAWCPPQPRSNCYFCTYSTFIWSTSFIWPRSGWAWPFSHFSLWNSFLCYFWTLSFDLFVTNLMGTLVLVLFLVQHEKASPDIFYTILLMLQLLVPFLHTFVPKEMMSYCTHFTALGLLLCNVIFNE